MKKSFKPLLYFEAALFVTSVTLIAAAFSAMKDAWGIVEWKLPLLSFTAWMAVTIVAATICAARLQWRIWNLGKIDEGAERGDVIVAFAPIVPGCFAAVQLIKLAWCTVGAPMF